MLLFVISGSVGNFPLSPLDGTFGMVTLWTELRVCILISRKHNCWTFYNMRIGRQISWTYLIWHVLVQCWSGHHRLKWWGGMKKTLAPQVSDSRDIFIEQWDLFLCSERVVTYRAFVVTHRAFVVTQCAFVVTMLRDMIWGRKNILASPLHTSNNTQRFRYYSRTKIVLNRE